MAGINSLLFLLTTISPFTEPPFEDAAVPCDEPYEWRRSLDTMKMDTFEVSTNLTNTGMCGPDTEFTLCLGDPSCQRSCDNWGQRMHCLAICSMGCICKKPLILGPYWNCVLPENCPNALSASRTDCQLHEEWSGCDAVPSCQRNCSNYDDPIICPKICIPGCVCKAPRVRGPDGTCITPRQCPTLQAVVSQQDSCESDEEFTECDASPRCQKSCANYNKHIACPTVCVPGCKCKAPKVRGPGGKCVLLEECPEIEAFPSDRTCKRDEEWSYCDGHPRCERNCLNYGTSQPCSLHCTEGCVCKKGTIRGPGGKCILPQQCFHMQAGPVPVCKPNEEFNDCFGNPICQKNCANYNDPISCPYVCHPGCVCKDSLIRGPDGECIPIDQCPANTSQLSLPVCKSNEAFTPCYGNPRCEKNCNNYNNPKPCPPICIPGCVCTLPTIRGPDGDCVLPDKCAELSEISAPKCKPNQEFSSCSANPICQRNCVNYMHPLICPFMCTPGCVCKKPLVIGPDGECIHPDQCPANLNVPKPQCSSDEEFSYCEANPFCQKTCLTHKFDTHCPDDCHPGCACKAPLIRDSYGKCIHPDQCPVLRDENPENLYSEEDVSAVSSETLLAHQIHKPSCPRNEEFSTCYAHCETNCSNYMKPRYCQLACLSGCVCKKSMIRGPDGRCIYPKDCPATLNDNLLDLDYEMSEKVTEDELSEQISGPQDQVHLNKCGSNEVLKSCPSVCPDTCWNFRRTYRTCKSVCLPGMRCECKDGFVEGPTGDCITPEQCPGYTNYEMTEEDDKSELLAPQGQFFSCFENEVYRVCPSSCPDNCDNFQDTFRPCKLICLPIPKCECKAGFVKGPDGSCIKPDQCPSHEKKPEDCTELEYYDTCGTGCEDNCTNYDQEDKMCTKKCVVGCFCLPGYVRGPKGQCIWPFDCWGPNSPQRMDSTSSKQDMRYLENSNRRLVLPPLSCKKANEEYSLTSSICPDTCDNYKNPRRACNYIWVPGCKCSDGYVRNKSGDCIRMEQCPDDGKSCPEHEEYLECGTACPQNCTNYDKNEPCIELCVSGCFCKEPLIRSPEGKCIHRDNCPQTLEAPRNGWFDLNVLPGMCKKNEEFSFLRSLCPDTCENYNYPERSCSYFKLPGCQCKEGYVFERSGICIRKEQCVEERPEDCTEMESYDHCGSYCEADCTNYNHSIAMCEDHRCKKGCFCNPEYVRAPDWTCVLPLDCPRRQVSNSYF